MKPAWMTRVSLLVHHRVFRLHLYIVSLHVASLVYMEDFQQSGALIYIIYIYICIDTDAKYTGSLS